MKLYSRKMRLKKGGGVMLSKPKQKSSSPISSSSRKKKMSTSPPRSRNTTKNKKKTVTFSEKNEIREQSPKSEDEFYYPAEVNHKAKRRRTLKEKASNKRIRKTAKIDYINREREQYILDLVRGNI